MSSEQVFELAILLSLRDVASGKLDTIEAKLRSTGKEGKQLLQTFQSLRDSLNRDLAIGGVGIAGLALLRNGVNAAAVYETSLLDLKSAYQEVAGAGNMSAAEQAAQLNQLEQLAVRLGNNLQGTTSDYIGILASLRKAGVDAQTVLGGAGEAASYLANVSGALTRGGANDLAKQLGQYGKLYKLNPDEFKKSVDLFSALKDRFDIDSSDLIESAKYFQNTASSLKLTGFSGAEETSKFFALIKRQGAIEGSQAGTSATSFFQQFIAHAEQRAKIKKKTGFEIQLFDTKGNFLGLENAFREMEKFRKFSSEQRLSMLNELFGEQGGKVAGVMVDAGAEGWRNVTIEAGKAVTVQQKINDQMASYNAKMEALSGTLENIKAVSFMPMLDTLKPPLDMINNIAVGTQELAKANPELAGMATRLAGVASVSLTVYAGFNAMRTGWRMWRIASAVSAGDSGLLQHLIGIKKEANETAKAAGEAAKSVEVVTTKAGRLRGAIRSVGSIAGVIGAGLTIDQFIQLQNEISTLDKQLEDWRKHASDVLFEFWGNINQYTFKGLRIPREVTEPVITDVAGKYNQNNVLERKLDNWSLSNFGWNIYYNDKPFTDKFAPGQLGDLYDPKVADRRFQSIDRRLLEPQLMREWIRGLKGGTIYPNLSQEGRGELLKTFEQSPYFGESYKRASVMLAEELKTMIGQTDAAAQGTQLLNTHMLKLPDSLQGASDATIRLVTDITNFANQLNGIEIKTPVVNTEPLIPRVPPSPTPTITPTLNPARTRGRATRSNKSAIGSIVTSDGLVEAHRGNVIFPANLSRRSPGDWLEDLTALRAVANVNVRENVSIRENRASFDYSKFIRQNVNQESNSVSNNNTSTKHYTINVNVSGDVKDPDELAKKIASEIARIDAEVANIKGKQSRRELDRRGARALTIGKERA